MKFMSFNTQHCLNYMEQKIDFEIMANAILELGADVVGLNEMRGAGEHPDYTAQVERLAELTGMKYYYFAPALEITGCGTYGNGLLSRVPILKAERILIPDPVPHRHDTDHYETRCVLVAELEGGVTVLVTHFGLNSDEQENAAKTVTEHLRDKKCVLMGDFNVIPEDPVLTPIRARLFDSAALFAEEKGSYPSDFPNRTIDYLFVSRDVTVLSADIPPVVASDHRPYIAELSFD